MTRIPRNVLKRVSWLCLFLVLSWPGNVRAASPAGSPHPLGREVGNEARNRSRLVVHDLEIQDEHPVFGPETVILSTVGTEHEENGETVFHPLVSVAIDRTFDRQGPGEWLALWNMGRKSPGIMSRIGATVPVYLPWRRSSERQLRKLDKHLHNFDRRWEQGKVSIPKPYLNINQKNRRSTIGLVFAGIKRGLGPLIEIFPVSGEVSFGVELLFRNYLLRNKDIQERDFAQAYLGMLWYTDAATADDAVDSLSAPEIEEIKYRLLKERNIFGRWVGSSAKPDFVHGFESQMRDHLWGTSCFLASVANRHHLVYEELQRVTPTGVPIALGGILYYDPAIAPEAEQVRWSINNPFDLSYNPFVKREVQAAAASGARVPLSIYVYQSNMALKPIIVADFFSPDNPRIREAATYWRKLGNEALSTGGVGLLINLLNRAFSFAVNRKELTWFSDRKFSYGIEELRLSLANHLYFEEEAAEELVDRIDRVIVNPLAQPSREKALRAQIQYKALLADDGAAVLETVRKIREKRVRNLIPENQERKRPLVMADYQRYQASLEAHHKMEVLRVFLEDRFLPSIPAEDVRSALQELASERHAYDRELTRELQEFRFELQRRPAAGPMSEFRAQVMSQTEETLLALYLASGRSQADLEAEFVQLRTLQEAAAEKARKDWEKDHAGKVEKEIKDSLKVLEGFVASGGDLNAYSPWYITESLEIMQQIPQAIEVNPMAADRFAKFEARITAAVDGTQHYLEPERGLAFDADADWMAEQRGLCLLSAQATRLALSNLVNGRGASRVSETGQGANPR